MAAKSFLESMPQTAQERRQVDLEQNPQEAAVDHIKGYAVGELGYFLPTMAEVEAARPILEIFRCSYLGNDRPVDIRYGWPFGCLRQVQALSRHNSLGFLAYADGTRHQITDHAGLVVGEQGTYPSKVLRAVMPYTVETPRGNIANFYLRRTVNMYYASSALRNMGYIVFVSENHSCLGQRFDVWKLSSAQPHHCWDTPLPAPQRMSVLIFFKPGAPNWYELYVSEDGPCMCREYHYGDCQYVQRPCRLHEVLYHFVMP
ncbi:MAG: hypothetical protein VB104_06730 [Candidatus Limiplasma sp.]|nr:hypothetical protein [Candidatus Limiplasma sp.]